MKLFRDFFELIYKQQNATREEVINFLNHCLNYVFETNNIDISQYKITLHPTKTKVLDDADAKVEQDEKNPNQFDVYFDDKFLSFKGTKKIKNAKKSKEREFQSESDYMGDFLNFIYVMFHEFHHIIQYIKKPKVMKNWEETKLSIAKLTNSINSFDLEKAEKKELLSALSAHEDAMDYVSRIEREANKQAHVYFAKIIDKLSFLETDPELEELFYSFYTFINKIRKDEFYFYRKYNKINAEKLRVLEGYNIYEEDLLS